jgi:gamma-glutamyltranspeptidase/glutathione hydrolase
VLGALPVTVPGTVDGWCTALEAFGTMPLERLLQPAIFYAEQGLAVNAALADAIRDKADALSHLEGWRSLFLPDDAMPAVGQRFLQRDLGATLRTIAAEGRDVFYRGYLAQRIADTVQRQRGFLAREDLATHRSEWVAPIDTCYRGHTVYQMPPNSRGAIVLIALNILQEWDLSSLNYDSAEAVHVMAHAYKLARQAFDEVAGDSAHVPVPMACLLSHESASALRSKITRQPAPVPATKELETEGDTVFVAVVDREGNAVAFIDSTYYTFGSGLVVEGTGLLLQNRGAYFGLDPDNPNCLAPGKRPVHTLMPAIVFRNGVPWLVLGSMGGDGQAQTQVQLLHRIVDLGMNVQEAIEAPRWVLGGTLVDERIDALRLETRFSPGTVKALEQCGYPVMPMGPWSDRLGVAQAIIIDSEQGMLHGAADPRGEGLALGW